MLLFVLATPILHAEYSKRFQINSPTKVKQCLFFTLTKYYWAYRKGTVQKNN